MDPLERDGDYTPKWMEASHLVPQIDERTAFLNIDFETSFRTIFDLLYTGSCYTPALVPKTTVFGTGAAVGRSWVQPTSRRESEQNW